MSEVVVWAVDIGSVMKNRFGWCRKAGQARKSGHDNQDLACGVVEDLANGKRVALGFECPLFVPITDDPTFLTRARTGEGSRSWSAGAGCGALTTGLSETVWVLERIRCTVTEPERFSRAPGLPLSGPYLASRAMQSAAPAITARHRRAALARARSSGQSYLTHSPSPRAAHPPRPESIPIRT